MSDWILNGGSISVIGRRSYVLAVLPFALIAIVGARATAVPDSVSAQTTDSSRLVSIQEFPTLEGCAWDEPASQGSPYMTHLGTPSGVLTSPFFPRPR